MTLTIQNNDKTIQLASFVQSFVYHGYEDGLDLIFNSGLSNDDISNILTSLETLKDQTIVLTGDSKITVTMKLNEVSYNSLTHRITLMGEDFSWN